MRLRIYKAPLFTFDASFGHIFYITPRTLLKTTFIDADDALRRLDTRHGIFFSRKSPAILATDDD